MSPDRPQLTSLLSNDALHRLERLRLQLRRRFTNPHRGEHLSGRGGTSTEFSDYRDYVAGDDTRFVDWNIFARLHRPYVKLFHQEEELHVLVLVDASRSMGFENKLTRAAELAAAFGALGLLGGERVSVWAFTGRADRPVAFPPRRGRRALRQLFSFLEGLEAAGDCPLEAGVEAVLHHHAGRGAAVVLSDFLTAGDLVRPFNALTAAGLEIFGVQILGPSETAPELDEDLRLVDAETGRTLDVSAGGDLLTFYHEFRLGHEARLASLLRQRAGRFISVCTETPIETVLFDDIRRKGWVR